MPTIAKVFGGYPRNIQRKESEQDLPADQLIQLHAQACLRTAKEPEQTSAEQSQQSKAGESKQALAEFFNRYCQHSYRNPVDTANALHKLRQQYRWPDHVLAYFTILDQQLLHHREALSARGNFAASAAKKVILS